MPEQEVAATPAEIVVRGPPRRRLRLLVGAAQAGRSKGSSPA
jgi:hypothetical protein